MRRLFNPANARRVHLCCGPEALLRGWTNVDRLDFGQEIVADLSKGWEFLPAGSVHEIYCKDGFEHFESAEFFLAQASKLLEPGGTLRVWVPHWKNPSAYRLSHRTLFSWSLFNAFPEPHDETKDLRVISNRLYIGWRDSAAWRPIHWLINLAPKWWERFGYVSNIEVVFEKVR